MDQVLKTIRETDPPLPSNRFTTMTEEQRTSEAHFRQVEPSALSKLVRGDLDWIVMKCLEKDRARRYETASVLASDISSFLEHQPVIAAVPGAGYQIRKFVRRNRTSVIAIMSIALAVLLIG
jgi:hypothetical protein